MEMIRVADTVSGAEVEVFKIALTETGSELRFFRRSLRSLPPRLRLGPPAIKRGCLGLQNLNLQTIANDRYWLRYTAICRSFA